VTEKQTITVKGYYAPLTNSGEVLVNGFLASCYIQSVSWISQEVTHLGMKPLITFIETKRGLGYYPTEGCEEKAEGKDNEMHPYVSALWSIFRGLGQSL